ncbi:MAG: hypothetical protein H7Y43_12730, partial [Akkermansiaceae bacterium]|nr:hypothetical protein [Verrucomicrobiales bacterium]
MKKFLLAWAMGLVASGALAHYVPGNEYAITNASALPLIIETKGPVRAPAPIQTTPALKVSGQGFWKFVAARECVPVPVAVPSVKQA